jgi:hypothetical protein
MSETDVHTEHCCLEHGCKYNNPECTVTTGQKVQSYSCETCDFVEETERVRGEEFRRQVAETLEKVDSLLPKNMLRASGITFNVRLGKDDPEWRILIEFLADGRGFTPHIPVKSSQREALKALMAWVKNIGVTDLAARVDAGIQVLDTTDLLRESIFEHVFKEVQFKVNKHDVALNLYIHKDGTFKVASSSSVPTDEYEAYMKAFARSADFVRVVGLKPQPKRA